MCSFHCGLWFMCVVEDWNSHFCIREVMWWLGNGSLLLVQWLQLLGGDDIWQWLFWFIVRFWYFRQWVSVVSLDCYLGDWNIFRELWTPRTCMRYPYYVSSDCKCCVTKDMLRVMFCDGWGFGLGLRLHLHWGNWWKDAHGSDFSWFVIAQMCTDRTAAELD